MRGRWTRWFGRAAIAAFVVAMLLAVPAAAHAAVPEIAGTITVASTSGPIEGVTVELYALPNWDWAGSTSTAADGSYSFYGLADGDYYLGFNGGRYGEKYYDWNYAYLTVAGTRPIIQDVGLVENAPEIAGTITDAGGAGTPIGDVRVELLIRTTVRAPTTSTPKHIATRVVATI